MEIMTEDEKFRLKRLVPMLTAISFILGIFIGAVLIIFGNSLFKKEESTKISTSGSNYSSSDYNVDKINSIFQVFNQKYIFQDQLDEADDITYGMIKGFIESLDDEYTNFLDPEEAKIYFEQASGDFDGIGVSLAYNGTNTYVESVLKNYPAESAGLIPGDIILNVDGEDVSNEFPALVAQKIRGESGTKVKLEIYRTSNDGDTRLEFGIERKFIDVDNIAWEKLSDDTVKIDIYQFSDNSAKELNDLWDRVVGEIEAEIPDTQLKNVIVDLRGNPGGYVYSVRYIIEEFLNNDSIVMRERSRSLEERIYRDNREGSFEDENIVILVNESSASASEIFASALRENDRALIVGQNTVGKGVEQELVTLDDGSLLLIVFQEWLTPNGNKITKDSPIIPDFAVEYSVEEYVNKNDTQLNKALELLSE